MADRSQKLFVVAEGNDYSRQYLDRCSVYAFDVFGDIDEYSHRLLRSGKD